MTFKENSIIYIVEDFNNVATIFWLMNDKKIFLYRTEVQLFILGILCRKTEKLCTVV